jgi:cell division septal protein FtsQ
LGPVFEAEVWGRIWGRLLAGRRPRFGKIIGAGSAPRLGKGDDGRRKVGMRQVSLQRSGAARRPRTAAAGGWQAGGGRTAAQAARERDGWLSRGPAAAPSTKPGPSWSERLSIAQAAIGRALRLVAGALTAVLTLATLLALAAAGYLWASDSDLFTVRPDMVKVSGLSRLTRDEILAAAGLDRPVNNVTFDVSAAFRSLSSLPWVERVEVGRTLPDGLSVEVTEYRAKALVNLYHLYYMDARGRPFKKLDPGEAPDLPIVGGFSSDELLAAGPLARRGVAETFELMDALSARTDELRLENISELHYDHDRGLTVFTRRGGLKIKFGLGAYEEKLRRLGRVLAYLKLRGQLEGLRSLNLDVPPRVTARWGSKGRPLAAVPETALN